MLNYYCKSCNNLVGKWNNKYKNYKSLKYCNYINSKNIKFVNFLDCKNCKKFIGIECWYVCKNCFGKNQIFGEKNLFSWFQQYKKIKPDYVFGVCQNCIYENFRLQYWYFDELTFYK